MRSIQDVRKIWWKKYHIYKTICKYKGKILENHNKKVFGKMELKKNSLIYEEINNILHIKILKTKKIAAHSNSIHNDKIVIKFIVYR